MSDSAIAMPPLAPHPLPAWRWLSVARDNGLAIWHQGAFGERLMHRRLPGRALWVVNNPADVRRVLATDAAHYSKSPEIRRALAPLLGQSLLVSEGEAWRQRRRLMAPLLTRPERLLRYEGLMIHLVSEMLERWAAPGAAVERDLVWESTRLAAEIISQALFSYPLGDQAATIFAAFQEYQDTLGRLDVMSLLGLPGWLPRPGEAVARRAVGRMEQVVEQIIRAAEQRDGHDDDLPALLLAPDAPQAELLGPRQVRDEFMLALLAGHETTANALCWTLLLLSRDARVRGLLEAEVARELGTAAPTPGDCDRLVYCRAVIHEALRLFPPIYQLTRQPLVPTQLSHATLAPGSLVILSPWLLHRHRRFWKRPDSFYPERFLEPAGPRRRYCFIPFGAGPRVCPGASFAQRELQYAVAMITQRFRLELRPGTCVAPLGRLTLRPRGTLPMRLHPR